MTRRIFLAVGILSLLTASAAGASEYVNVTPVTAQVGEDGQRVIEMPDKKTTSRRRMLFDFGLFGAGIHVGWLKPRSAVIDEGNGGDVMVRRRHGVGTPIFNVSAGTHAIGLGTH